MVFPLQVFTSDGLGSASAVFSNRITATAIEIIPLTADDAPDEIEIDSLEIFACFDESLLISTTAATSTPPTTITTPGNED